ncbi:hypothetical protein [Streptomyces sp. NPDC051546]|uniref:hypothetical protein n=1 Tax=Streptomyces sp. NPDC051546 TaxID=3365655 RepID=UPI0037BB8A1D
MTSVAIAAVISQALVILIMGAMLTVMVSRSLPDRAHAGPRPRLPQWGPTPALDEYEQRERADRDRDRPDTAEAAYAARGQVQWPPVYSHHERDAY